jgi:hypothetical protein
MERNPAVTRLRVARAIGASVDTRWSFDADA